MSLWGRGPWWPRFGKEKQVSDEATVDRNQLIDRAQQLGIDRPWFKSNDDLQTAIAEEEHRQGSIPTTRTTVDEPGTSDPDATYADVKERGEAAKAFEPPAEGADHPDPYAHLGGSVDPSTYDEEEGTTDE